MSGVKEERPTRVGRISSFAKENCFGGKDGGGFEDLWKER